MQTTNANKFGRYNQPFTCIDCGKRTTDRAADSGGQKVCGVCWAEYSRENTHNDRHSVSEPETGCKWCATDLDARLLSQVFG